MTGDFDDPNEQLRRVVDKYRSTYTEAGEHHAPFRVGEFVLKRFESGAASVTFEEIVAHFREQAEGTPEGSPARAMFDGFNAALRQVAEVQDR